MKLFLIILFSIWAGYIRRSIEIELRKRIYPASIYKWLKGERKFLL